MPSVELAGTVLLVPVHASPVPSVLRGSFDVQFFSLRVRETFVVKFFSLFDTSNGNYTRVYPLKDTAYKRKKHGAEELLKNMTTEDRSRVRANQLSTDGTLDATLISACPHRTC